MAAPAPVIAVPEFTDGFESGDLTSWMAGSGLTVQTSVTHLGSGYAARNTASKAWVSTDLPFAQADLFVRVWVNVRSQSEEFQVLRLRTVSESLASLSILGSGRLRIRNYVSGNMRTSSTRVHRRWNDLQVRTLVNGDSSRIRVWLDGSKVKGLASNTTLGTSGTATVEIGNRWKGRTYDAVYDDITLDTELISDQVIGAAGNIACDPNQAGHNGGDGTAKSCHMRHTSDLLLAGNYDAVFALGDNQYICGGLTAYDQSYDPTWGRVYDETYAVPGDKEYRNTNNAPTGTGCQDPPSTADGYQAYFANAPAPAVGAPPGRYYSFDLGAWHIVALNGACYQAGGCDDGDLVPDQDVVPGDGAPQYEWLLADLAASTRPCTLAFWHQPRFSSGAHGNDARYRDFWNALYADGVELTLHAHEHTYERFLPQDPQQNPAPTDGIVEFVVGSGGHSHVRFPDAGTQPNSAVRDASTFGILQLTLHEVAWKATFVPEAGATFTDSAAGQCH